MWYIDFKIWKAAHGIWSDQKSDLALLQVIWSISSPGIYLSKLLFMYCHHLQACRFIGFTEFLFLELKKFQLSSKAQTSQTAQQCSYQGFILSNISVIILGCNWKTKIKVPQMGRFLLLLFFFSCLVLVTSKVKVSHSKFSIQREASMSPLPQQKKEVTS